MTAGAIEDRLAAKRRLAAALEERGRRWARKDSAVFVDGLFGIRSTPFQRDWHATIAAHREVVIWAPIEHGKTQRLLIGWPIWNLGVDARMRGLLVGSSASQAEKAMAVIRRQIEENPYVRAVFPALRPLAGKYAKWTDQAIRIEGGSMHEKDYSLAATGVGGPILGARLTVAILDDVLDFENTYTASQRQKVLKWFRSTLLGRIVEGGQVVVVGNAWYPDDLMHVLEKEGFTSVRQAAYRERADGSIDPASVLWPAQWPLARLLERRARFGTIETRRQLLCQPYAAGAGRFRDEWFDWAFEAGVGLKFAVGYRGDWGVFTGVDLGVQEDAGHDRTVLFTIAVEPETNRRRVLSVIAERMEGPGIRDAVVDVYQRFGGMFMVENNAAQAYLEQFVREKGVPICGFTTGKQKADPHFGVASLGVELEQRLWMLPAEPVLAEWKTECLSYSPGGGHPGDLLMASWFAREAARQGDLGASEAIDPSEIGEGDVSRDRWRGLFGGRGAAPRLRARYALPDRRQVFQRGGLPRAS